MLNRFAKLLLLAALLMGGIWLVARASAPAAETSARQAALGALAPGRPLSGQEAPAAPLPDEGEVGFTEVDLSTLPTGPDAANGLYARWLRGEVDLSEGESLRPPAEIAARQAEALALPPSAAIQTARPPRPRAPRPTRPRSASISSRSTTPTPAATCPPIRRWPPARTI